MQSGAGQMPKLRLHKSSVVVGVAMAMLLALICIPGRAVDYQPILSKTFEHGWPLTYLRRQTDQTVWSNVNGMQLTLSFTPVLLDRRESVRRIPMLGIPWLNADSWMIWDAEVDDNGEAKWQVWPAAFGVDVATTSVVLAITILAWEYRRRRRPSVFTFTLADLFVAITSVSVVMAYLFHEQRSYLRELAFVPPLGETNLWCEENCIAPVWLQSLIGERLMPPAAWRVASIYVDAMEWPEPHRLVQELKKYPHLSTLEISGSFSGNGRLPYSQLRALPALATLKLTTTPRLDFQDVHELSELTRLRTLVLDEQVTTELESIPRLKAAMPNCNVVDSKDNW